MTKVLIAVFDGLQPSQITPELTPNLFGLASRGVMFRKNHPVFPTVTRINAATLVTGQNPGEHGLAANTVVIREYDPNLAFSALEPELSKVVDKLGNVLLQPTLADILSAHGMEYVAIGVGTSGNAFVHNPIAHKSGGATIHHDFTLPRELRDELISRFGEWPDESRPNTPRYAQAVRVMTEYILPERNPAVTLIWSSEPDKSQHEFGVGAPEANLAIQEADEQFGKLVKWLDESGRLSETDIIIAFDHGYSTISEVVDVEAEVREAGFPEGSSPGGVIVAPNGGSVLFYTHESDRGTADKLAAWLMEQEWCGALIVSEAVSGIEGTIPATLVGIDGPRAPELAMSFAWNSEPNKYGYPGFAYSTGGEAGLGQHGSLSKHELNNVLVASGPSFKNGIATDVPTGNIDIAPTVLSILGIYGQSDMDGRVLEEALLDGPELTEVVHSTETHAAERALSKGTYRQSINVSRVAGTVYVDEGSAERVNE